MGALKFDNKNFEHEVIKSEGKVVVDFYADWCGPCKIMSPIIDGIADGAEEKVKVGKVNIDENPELATQYGVMSIPTIIIFENGNPIKTFVGVTPVEDIVEYLK